jgi:hypothetical protein
MAIDDVYQVTVTSRLTGAGVAQNTFAFIRTTAAEPVNADFDSLAEAIKTIHRTLQNPVMNYSTWRARQVRGTGVTWPASGPCAPQGGKLYEGNVPSPLAGSGSGDALPPQCALVVTLKTALAGRRHRGRVYVTGWGEGDQVAGVWQSSILTTLATTWNTFMTAYAVVAPTSGFRLGIWSFRTASGCIPNPNASGHTRIDPPDAAQAFTAVSSYVLRNTVYTQRRRVSGVGV